MGARRKARECAVQMLYAMDIGKAPADDVIPGYWEVHGGDPPVREFASRIVRGVELDRERIDELLKSYTEHWRLDRLAAVDRSVLRMAVYEFLAEPSNPPAVVINEAIEIVRKFGDKESAQFINGVLDGILKSLSAARAS